MHLLAVSDESNIPLSGKLSPHFIYVDAHDCGRSLLSSSLLHDVSSFGCPMQRICR